jgi:biopolymer transport protein ExbB
MGLIEAFRAVAEAPADQKAAILTKSISLAMNCTAFGLMVGIPCLFMHMAIMGIVKKIVDDIDMYSVKLENLLITRGKGGGAETAAPAE